MPDDRSQATEALRSIPPAGPWERALRDALGELRLLAVGLDRDGRITFTNPFLLELTGYSRDELLHEDWFSIFAPQDPERRVRFESTFGRNAASSFETSIRARNGEERLIRWTATSLHDADGHAVAELRLGEDVTELERAERERSARLRRVEMLDAVSQAFGDVTLDYEAALALTVRRASELIGDTCVLAELSADGQSLRTLACHDTDPDFRALVTALTTLAPVPVTGSPIEPVLREGRALLSERADADLVRLFARPGEHPFLEEAHLLGSMTLPMRVHGRVTGALMLLRHREQRAYSDEDRSFAQAIADRAASVIRAANLYAENLRQAEELRLANRDLERRIAERTAELARANELLSQQATEDGLTGLANRRRFDEVLAIELRRARRNGEPLALLMCDVDFFKRYNDEYGHPAGDACLAAVAGALKRTFRRASDLCARYGGEEFAVVLAGCDEEHALMLAERLRANVEELALPHARSEVAGHVTLSVGVVSSAVAEDISAEWFLRVADGALYKSKRSGRNRVSVGH